MFRLASPFKEPFLTNPKSFILVDNAVDEKPANTAECIAPILAHASKEIANYGIIGT